MEQKGWNFNEFHDYMYAMFSCNKLQQQLYSALTVFGFSALRICTCLPAIAAGPMHCKHPFFTRLKTEKAKQ